MSEERDIGAEILEGIRELKAGNVGRVINVESVDTFELEPDQENALLEAIAEGDRGEVIQADE